MTDVATEVKQIAERHVTEGTVTDMETNLVELGMDSLRMVAFMVDLQTRFSISFPPELVDAATFRTPASALAAIQAIRSGT